MPNAPISLVVIIGSTREGRFAPTVASWFVDRVRRHGGFVVDVVDLAETAPPAVMTASPGDADRAVLDDLSPRLDAADAFVVVPPDHSHSFPAGLKNAIDWHRAQWQAKPVGFVSYGGLAGGLRAVEHLRLVFAELHAVTVRDSVSFHNAWERFGDDGLPLDSTVCDGAAANMLDQLGWWARALRDARSLSPYAA